MYGLNPLPRGTIPIGDNPGPGKSNVKEVGYHLAPFRRMEPGVSLDGFRGVAICQTQLPSQIDVGIDGVRGIVVHQTDLPQQIDIGLDGIRGIVVHQTPYPFSPIYLTPDLWLDATDATTLYDSTSGGSLSTAGGTCDRWEDKSGNGRHAVRAGTADLTRETGQINGLDAVNFAGSGYMTLPNFLSGSAGALFWVARQDFDPTVFPRNGAYFGRSGTSGLDSHEPFTDGTIYHDWGSTTRKTVGNPTPSMASWRYGWIISKANSWVYSLQNSTLHSTGTNTVGWTTAPLIGNSVGGYILDGRIAELIVLLRDPTVDEIANIKKYFTNKYAL